ncbi:Asp-tRNA(Asn)/Glu-tRNA(Gln) amidotransferase subunit GatC [Pseudokineococcus marinus]|uniref:Aspartyl/glutamyl-tRNA(Asn/Gln) amidotransferase subunit C n=1 Tax=Pseudokineococcus marinus TaxID=351215 RepID=A0A849BRL3_9ACTN|nr:Asp-tRNA(Asn)/Glu-tRNA(Gln) amidotransferase subunit GatC [Pseudokineococcus marinus]NNH23472.1 Asp-tRNA(Asn)/Glu-tRNA(Gln) amidotransferase subunit GatC [Pseudokineococcus marinus]
MPALSPDDVARLAALARIDLEPAELERLAGELDAVVAAVASVSSVVSDDVPATSHPLPLVDVYREDVVEPSLPAEAVLAGAPAAQDGRFLVPQILEED